MDVCQYIFAKNQSEQLTSYCQQLYEMLNKNYNHIICFRKDDRVIFRFLFRGFIFNISTRYDSLGKAGMKLVVDRIICYATTVEEIDRFLKTYHTPPEFWKLYRIFDLWQSLLFCIWRYDDNSPVITFYVNHKESKITVVMRMFPVIKYKVKIQTANKKYLYTAMTIQGVIKIIK